MPRWPSIPLRFCSILSCNKAHYAKNLCEIHYKQYREQHNVNKRKCSFPNCNKSHYGWKLCKQHYKQEYKRRWRNSVRDTPEYKLEKNLRNRHNAALKNNKKTKHPIKHLGCSIEELKTHLESLFYPHPITGEMMSWDNRGVGVNTWQVDHILPIGNIAYVEEEEQLKLVNYKNLQPLWWEDHVIKSASERWMKNEN